MHIILGWALLTESDNVKQFFDTKFGESNYQLFEEESEKLKIHVHFIVITKLKKNTFDKDLKAQYPKLVRPRIKYFCEKDKKIKTKPGGENRYLTRDYPEQYEVQAYDELGQDYVAKDGKPIGGTLWINTSEFHSTSKDNPLPTDTGLKEHELRAERYWRQQTKNKNHQREAKTSLEQKFQNYMNEILEKDPWYFYKINTAIIGPDLPKLNQRLLIREIKNFYKSNGRPANRAIHKVIAEAVIWYGEIVCQKDKETIEDNNNAIYNEMDKLLTGR